MFGSDSESEQMIFFRLQSLELTGYIVPSARGQSSSLNWEGELYLRSFKGCDVTVRPVQIPASERSVGRTPD